jgi:hypothetical protein
MAGEFEHLALTELKNIRTTLQQIQPALQRLVAAAEGRSGAPALGGPPVTGTALGGAEALRSSGQTPESTQRRRGARQPGGGRA